MFPFVVLLAGAARGFVRRAPRSGEFASPTFLVAAILAIGGCSDAEHAQHGSTVTYQRDIRPLLEANCVECHTEGGIGPSVLSDWNTVRALGPAIVNAVTEGRMPPWPASSDCHELLDARSLPQAAKDTFAAWQSNDFAQGDQADYVAPELRRRENLGPPSLTMQPSQAFTPQARADNYNCFVIGSIDAPTFVTALGITPGINAEVHHVQLHRIDVATLPKVQALDDKEPDPGYECSSAGIGAGLKSENIFSYRPGGVPVVFAPGEALYLKGGSALVMQIHYNTQFLPSDAPPQADTTKLSLWTLPADQAPERVIYRTGLLSPLNGAGDGSPLALLSVIPANQEVVGESDLSMQRLIEVGAGSFSGLSTFVAGEIVGMTPHAHAWATRMTASLTRADGQQECLIDVPHWDYGWQLDYLFQSGVPYGANDMLHVECDYDNTAAHQPVVNGQRLVPDVIPFGENTLNEMCLHYLWLRFSYADFLAAGL